MATQKKKFLFFNKVGFFVLIFIMGFNSNLTKLFAPIKTINWQNLIILNFMANFLKKCPDKLVLIFVKIDPYSLLLYNISKYRFFRFFESKSSRI
jgi:hypothetical protein